MNESVLYGNVYCAFCENNASHVIKETNTPICSACRDVYENGQASPNNTIADIEEWKDEEENRNDKK